MPRRLLTPLLTALALLLIAAPAAVVAAPAATSAPAARTAVDCADDELSVEEEDGTLVCEPDDLGADDDLDALCEDDWSDDEDWGDDEGGDEEEAYVADDDCADAADVPAVLSGLQATVAGRGRGAQVTVGFTLDVAGTVELTLARSEVGTASGKRCVVRTAKKGKAAKGKRCTRTTGFGGPVEVAGRAGVNSVSPRRWKGRKLRPGTYVVSATTGDGAKTATFKVAAG
ncbi:MAG TPA: hypothetical protein VLK58_08110 [Conexibacter sp.]|nr:hypothetical protein [Conexibacter sp.]